MGNQPFKQKRKKNSLEKQAQPIQPTSLSPASTRLSLFSKTLLNEETIPNMALLQPRHFESIQTCSSETATTNPEYALSNIVVSDSGQHIAGVTKNKIILWDITFKLPRHIPLENANPILLIAFLSDKHLVCHSANSVQIWDIATLKCINTLEKETSQLVPKSLVVLSEQSLAFLEKGVIKFWDIDSNTLISLRHTNAYAISKLSGNRLISLSYDTRSNVKVWDLNNYQPLQCIPSVFNVCESGLLGCLEELPNKKILIAYKRIKYNPRRSGMGRNLFHLDLKMQSSTAHLLHEGKVLETILPLNSNYIAYIEESSNMLHIFDNQSRQNLRSLTFKKPVTCLAKLPGYGWVCGYADGSMNLFENPKRKAHTLAPSNKYADVDIVVSNTKRR